MNDPTSTELLTLAEVCKRFKGKIGKTSLVQHLKAVPFYADGPTYRKIGAKYLFTEGDVARIIESLACYSEELSTTRRQQIKAEPSELKAFDSARKRLAEMAAGQGRQRAKPTRRG